jgi:hypothetical protein
VSFIKLHIMCLKRMGTGIWYMRERSSLCIRYLNPENVCVHVLTLNEYLAQFHVKALIAGLRACTQIPEDELSGILARSGVKPYE